MKSYITLIVFVVIGSFSPFIYPQGEDDDILYNSLIKEIRCMVCQNQSIDDSNAPLAKDLRVLIRNKIEEGSNDDEIYRFLTDRYGDFILLKPPLKLSTLALWLFPLIFFIFGILIIINHNKNYNKNT